MGWISDQIRRVVPREVRHAIPREILRYEPLSVAGEWAWDELVYPAILNLFGDLGRGRRDALSAALNEPIPSVGGDVTNPNPNKPARSSADAQVAGRLVGGRLGGIPMQSVPAMGFAALSQQTPAARHALSKAMGARGGRRSARKRKKKAAAAPRARRRVKKSSARLKKGSAAAKAYMAKLRRRRKK